MSASSSLDHVNPFLGVDGAGNVLCGPCLPFSLVRLGPDTLPPHGPHGYSSRSPIIGFSHTHVSGTGGSGRYGNIAVYPYGGPARLHADPSDRAEEQAGPGFYRARLVPSGIGVELTSTPRAGLHRYTFPDGGPANLRIDAGAVIRTGDNLPIVNSGGSTGGFVEWATATELVGRGDFRGGWGHNFPYSVFFYARFRRAPDRRLVGTPNGWQAGMPAAGQGQPGVFVDGAHSMAVAHFARGGVIELEVGISYVSIAKARASVDREIAGASHEEIVARARAAWSSELSRVRVRGGSTDQQVLFNTSLYRLFSMPTDLGVDDEFSSWHSGVRQFTDIYCLWDSVRNANSLLGLIAPETEAGILNALLDVAEHTGWLPDAWIAGHSAMIQGGSSADILLCEAALKNLPGIDYARALHWMRKNAEQPSPDPRLYGRHLAHYRDHGYVPVHGAALNATSRTLEYAYQDWCIGRLAAHLGQPEVAARHDASSRRVWTSWRDDLRSFAPKLADGRWAEPYHPDISGRPAEPWYCPFFYEATGRQWSWNVQHDFAGLVTRFGGPQGFAAALDQFMLPAHDQESGGAHYWSKETMLHVPYLYHYAGRPDLSARHVRACLDRFFFNRRDGLLENEDMGCQSTAYLCGSLGFYPLMGQDLYWLTPPRFEHAEITVGSGRTLVIEADGAPERTAIRRITLNGRTLERYWVNHAELGGGGVLRYELTRDDDPAAWPSAPVPPTPAPFVS
jgi:predicted alpha-1,2-mannosidase